MGFLKDNLVPLLIGTVTLGILGFIMLSPTGSDDAGVVPTKDLVTSASQVAGEATASANLVEFSDFQCPACGSVFPILRRVKQEFGENMQFVYRHYPLPQHKNAKKAAEASEAAGAQGRFWEYHDLLFINQSEWENLSNPDALNKFIDYADSLGLDIERFRSELEGGVYALKVQEDLSAGSRLGVNSTPTIYINGKKVSLRSYDQLRAEIESVLE